MYVWLTQLTTVKVKASRMLSSLSNALPSLSLDHSCSKLLHWAAFSSQSLDISWSIHVYSHSQAVCPSCLITTPNKAFGTGWDTPGFLAFSDAWLYLVEKTHLAKGRIKLGLGIKTTPTQKLDTDLVMCVNASLQKWDVLFHLALLEMGIELAVPASGSCGLYAHRPSQPPSCPTFSLFIQCHPSLHLILTPKGAFGF